MRLGHANTVMKMQGATLPNVEAAGYVALSRVECDTHWRFVGDLSVYHFTLFEANKEPAVGYLEHARKVFGEL